MGTAEQNKNILITGAAGGLGRALALACAHRGARVLLVDKNLAGLEQTCDFVEAQASPAPGLCQLDLAAAGPDALQEMTDAMTEAYGPLDGLVHCAAHFGGLQPLDQVRGDEWLRSVQVNLNAAWLLSKTCLPSLRHAPHAVIVFVLDEPARTSGAYWGPYGISKMALRGLAGMLAEELEPTNCRVYGVEPGPMRTDLRAAAYLAENPETVPEPTHAAHYIARLVLGQGGSEDVIQRVPASG